MMLRKALALEIFKLDRTRPRSLKTQSLFYWSLGLWSCSLASFHNPGFYLHAVSVIKVSAKLHTAQHCKHEVQQGLPTHQLLNHLCQGALLSAIIRNLLHSLPCWAFPAHIMVASVHHEVQGLWTWGFYLLFEDSLTYYFFSFILNAMYFENINTKTQQRWKCIYKFTANLEHCPLLIKKLEETKWRCKFKDPFIWR